MGEEVILLSLLEDDEIKPYLPKLTSLLYALDDVPSIDNCQRVLRTLKQHIKRLVLAINAFSNELDFIKELTSLEELAICCNEYLSESFISCIPESVSELVMAAESVGSYRVNINELITRLPLITLKLGHMHLSSDAPISTLSTLLTSVTLEGCLMDSTVIDNVVSSPTLQALRLIQNEMVDEVRFSEGISHLKFLKIEVPRGCPTSQLYQPMVDAIAFPNLITLGLMAEEVTTCRFDKHPNLTTIGSRNCTLPSAFWTKAIEETRLVNARFHYNTVSDKAVQFIRSPKDIEVVCDEPSGLNEMVLSLLSPQSAISNTKCNPLSSGQSFKLFSWRLVI